MLRFIIFLLVIAAIVYGVVGYVGWIRQFNATVSINGARVPARVYKNHSGEVIVDTGRTPGVEYVVRSYSVGRPSHYSFFKYDYVMFSKQFPLLTTDLNDRSRSCPTHLEYESRRMRFLDCGRVVLVNLN